MYLLYRGRHKEFKPNVCFTREDVEVQFANGCDPVFDEWRRPDFEETQHAIFSRVHSKILTFYGRRRVCIRSLSSLR